MDPNQEQRERCGHCRRKLKPGHSDYCDVVCAKRARKLRYAEKQAREGKPSYSLFLRSVLRPRGISELAEASGKSEDEIRAWAEPMVAAGTLVGFRKDGALVVVGKPLAKGEVPEFVQVQRAQLAGDKRRVRAEQARRIKAAKKAKKKRARARKREEATT